MLIKVAGQTALRDTLQSGIHVPAANTAAIITIAGVAGRKHILHQVQWSYSAAPVAGRLTVTVNAITVFDVDVISGGPGGFGLEIAGGTNQAVVITLAAGGGTTVGKLNVQYTTETEGNEYLR
jgi:hypothetical protein